MSNVMLNRLTLLWSGLAVNAQRDGCATSKDLKCFRIRARAEGLPYLSDGLAGLSKFLVSALREGRITREAYKSIRFQPKDDSLLPAFLYSAWSKIFTDDGLGIGASFTTNDEGVTTLTGWTPPIEARVAVMWLRQLTVVFSKLQLPHDKRLIADVSDRFIANEEHLASIKGRLWTTQYANETFFRHHAGSKQRLTDVLISARRLLHKILCNVDPRDIVPRHGSGASACRTRPWERYGKILFCPVNNAIWPWLEFAAAGKDHLDQLLSAPFITDGYPRVARGVFVPKDYRGPRLISCEPATSMYYQQGLMSLLVSHLEQHPETSKFVNFTNQRINQDLAREGSKNRKLATLDLKDASDCLSMDLITMLWPKHWYDALCAVRSKVTEIVHPEKGSVKVPLRKHAPMGSATCFPVMALTIWALIKAARLSSTKPRAWIYGDDIICETRDASEVCDLLESVGLKVNRDKSFYNASPFRESCGKEYWDGFNTTPIYCRYNNTCDDSTVSSLCSFANNMALRHGTYECSGITELVKQMTGAPIIGIPDGLASLWESHGDVALLRFLHLTDTDPIETKGGGDKPRPHLLLGADYLCERKVMNRRFGGSPSDTRKGINYAKWFYRLRIPVAVYTKVKPSTWDYVLRSSLIGGDLGFTEQAALAKRVRYKYGWVALDW